MDDISSRGTSGAVTPLPPGEIFAGTARYYARYRPPYPDELVDRVAALVRPDGRVCDLGSGPGTVAIALAGPGIPVVALDPNPDMLDVGRRAAAECGPGGSSGWSAIRIICRPRACTAWRGLRSRTPFTG
ncbi:class I SAM-dependent methyltransferase [Streptomyces sp. NPDC052236]|uniref:class I SAM-dependent methyltransferase n=1 Tax=Streptomyces sp. NPDC052236 TaxID=3365686 RepID=UPI0037CD3DFD